MRTYEERAMDFIKELYEVKGKNTFEKNYGVRRIVAEYLSLHPRRRVKVEEGAARTAIITSDYVIYACDHGMEYLLAKPTRFKYKRMNFYIYPRAKVYLDMTRPKRWYDELTYNEQSFVDEICDLHAGNIGFLHGRLCIIDYAMNNHW